MNLLSVPHRTLLHAYQVYRGHHEETDPTDPDGENMKKVMLATA